MSIITADFSPPIKLSGRRTAQALCVIAWKKILVCFGVQFS